MKVLNLKKQILYYMPVEQPKRILFAHLAKCGGSTLNEYIKLHFPSHRLFAIDGKNPLASIEKFKNLSEKSRHKYELICGHSANSLIKFAHPDCLKTTMFREPVERVISSYYYKKNKKSNPLSSKIGVANMDLDKFIDSDWDSSTRNYYIKEFSGLSHKDILNDPDKAIAKATDHLLVQYDIIGFLDEYSQFIKILRSRANLRYEYDGGKINVTKNKPLAKDIHPSTIEKIKQLNHLDIALYNNLKRNLT